MTRARAAQEPTTRPRTRKSQKDDKNPKTTPGKSGKDDDEDDDGHMPVLPKVERSSLKTLFLGGGATCFQRHMQFAYPGTEVDVAEIDPAVTNANFNATGLPRDTPIKTYWGDARQFVERNQDSKQYDLIFGDAFNDFSVPWHLTTREFNEKIAKMMSPTGVYMINIIDVYESDATAQEKAEKTIADKKKARAFKKAEEIIASKKITDQAEQERIHQQEGERVTSDPAEEKSIRERSSSGPTATAGSSVPGPGRPSSLFPYLYIFGTDRSPGSGMRETFVVVASRQPLDLKDLALRDDDPQFFHNGRRTEPVPTAPRTRRSFSRAGPGTSS